MRGQGLNDLPRCELERRSSHHKGIFFEVPYNKNSTLYRLPVTPDQATASWAGSCCVRQ